MFIIEDPAAALLLVSAGQVDGNVSFGAFSVVAKLPWLLALALALALMLVLVLSSLA